LDVAAPVFGDPLGPGFTILHSRLKMDGMRVRLFKPARTQQSIGPMSEPEGISAVRAAIARACREAGREPASVTLVAVSESFAADASDPVIASGQQVFGENRVQEAKAKWPPLLARHSGIELHLVGALQSNKAKEAVNLFDAIHSVDRASLAEALGKEIA